jgi:prepilin-type N-terminal cleavage/methylation domain-containing protein
VHTTFRRGLTLIEVLVVLGITGLLISLLLAGVMKARDAALRTESTNNLRQIAIAVQHFASTHSGRLPTVGGFPRRSGKYTFPVVPTGPPAFLSILPFAEQSRFVAQPPFRPVALLLSPADPTAQNAITKGAAVSSYAANAQVFHDTPHISSRLRDGTANTIAFAEHYAFYCQGWSFPYWFNGGSFQPYHRPAFADLLDVSPVSTGDPPVSGPSEPGRTFQVAPSRNRCYPFVAQTPHSSGMLVAMADGSGRSLGPGISEATYWGLVTPAGGEILGGDW